MQGGNSRRQLRPREYHSLPATVLPAFVRRRRPHRGGTGHGSRRAERFRDVRQDEEHRRRQHGRHRGREAFRLEPVHRAGCRPRCFRRRPRPCPIIIILTLTPTVSRRPPSPGAAPSHGRESPPRAVRLHRLHGLRSLPLRGTVALPIATPGGARRPELRDVRGGVRTAPPAEPADEPTRSRGGRTGRQPRAGREPHGRGRLARRHAPPRPRGAATSPPRVAAGGGRGPTSLAPSDRARDRLAARGAVLQGATYAQEAGGVPSSVGVQPVQEAREVEVRAVPEELLLQQAVSER
mmetsp:Transcript_22613/g.54620  ORF Transcript_22613/g.54620 Transcript_22613/m.54620 type:complete len:294 (-) Transcript_22613:924-1805(-)